jgi:hypothetical protein
VLLQEKRFIATQIRVTRDNSDERIKTLIFCFNINQFRDVKKVTLLFFYFQVGEVHKHEVDYKSLIE